MRWLLLRGSGVLRDQWEIEGGLVECVSPLGACAMQVVVRPASREEDRVGSTIVCLPRGHEVPDQSGTARYG